MSKVMAIGKKVFVDYIQRGVEYSTPELAKLQANRVSRTMYPTAPVPYPEILDTVLHR